MLTSLMSPAIALNKENNLKNGGVTAVKFILTEEQKYANDKQAIKNIFNYYESLGRGQIAAKDKETRKLYNLAYGRINIEDYIEVDEDYASSMGGQERLEVSNLDFYPIIPSFVRSIVGSYDKSYNEYIVQAVNPEVRNDIIDRMNNDLRSTLINNVEALFVQDTAQDPPDIVKQKHELLMQSEKVQKFYNSEFRTEIEQWADHTMTFEDQYFNMKSIESRLLEQIIVTEDPTIHIDYRDGSYRPVILAERDTYCLRSPGSRDYSDSAMFGFDEHCTFADILNKEASRLSEKDVKKVSAWSNRTFGQEFKVNHMTPQFHKAQGLADSRQNWETYEMLEHYRAKEVISSTGYSPDLARVTTQYFYVPRKVGILVAKTRDGFMPPELVDEQHRITIPGVYEEGYAISAETLLYGEHIDWFYIPELWRGKKVANQGSRPILPGEKRNASIDDNEIWLELDRFEIQHSDPHERYGVYIPVHGGPVTNQYNDSASLVKTAAPWQVMFNWVHNRNKQLLSTEIGKFFLVPGSVMPKESLGGEWEEDPTGKFASVARDVGIVEGATSGVPGQQLSQNFGQVIDMTKTQEIIEKVNLGSLFKMECYQSIGLTPEFIFGDLSPHQSAKSVAMGQQRTITQLQHLLTRLNEIMVKTRTTMLSTAQHIAMKKPTVEMVFTTSTEGRAIFKTSTADFPLAKLGISVKSNGSDLDVIEGIKNYVATNNTLGADSLELATLMSFKSLPELFIKLKDIQDKRKKEKQQEYEQQKALQDAQLQAQQEATDKQIAADKEEKALDREGRIMERQIAALGYGQGTPEDIRKSILDLQTANAKQKELYDRAAREMSVQASKERNMDQTIALKQRDAQLKEQVTLKQLQQKDRELDLQEKDIKARNARTKAID